jgi:glycosyltransferase involved in cell wall biosynthesis
MLRCSVPVCVNRLIQIVGNGGAALVPAARRFVHPLARVVRRRVLPRLVPPASPTRRIRLRENTARVIGLLSSASGLGASARLCTDQLAASAFAVSTSDVAPLFGADDSVPYRRGGEGGASGAMAIYHLNPPKLLPGILRAGLSTYYGNYNVGYWAWELETLPPDWIGAIRFVDAVMVPSEFCRAAVARYTDKPVLVVPHPAIADGPAPPRRHDGAGPFTVLTMFNFGSSFERKNPHAALRAFKLAFGSDPHARLIVKTSAGKRYPHELTKLRAEAGDMSNVDIIDKLWSADRLRQAYREADVYLSLHRSEGYGLTIAEAMMMECPTVVTNWSGNVDFCREDTAFLVRHDLIDFRDLDPSYEGVTGARWADPSAEHAAGHLRLIRSEPEAGRAKARAARAFLIRATAENSYERALRSLAALQTAASQQQREARLGRA